MLTRAIHGYAEGVLSAQAITIYGEFGPRSQRPTYARSASSAGAARWAGADVRAWATVAHVGGKVGNLLAIVAAGTMLAVCGTGWALLDRVTRPVDGDSFAKDIAQEQAERLNDRLGHRNRPRDAEFVAATEVDVDPQADPIPGASRVAVLAWSGRVGGDEKATIDVRFTVTVQDHGPSKLGGHSSTAGSATRCYRYTLELYRHTTYRDIRCPAIADLPVPSASPVPRLPSDAANRLTAALRTATPATLATVVRAAFPQQEFVVDTTTADGTLVAAVGVPAERDCILMIRNPDGTTKQIGFDRIQLEPGETGCRTALYTHPVR